MSKYQPNQTVFLKTGERVTVDGKCGAETYFVTIHEKDGTDREDIVGELTLYTEERLARAILWDLEWKERERNPEKEALNEWFGFCWDNKLSHKVYTDGLRKIRRRFHELQYPTK